MPTVKRTKAKATHQLTYKQLDYTITYKPAGVKTSDDLKPYSDIIGQARAVESIKTGLKIKSTGYNIFVTGRSGTGRITTIKHLMEQLEHDEPNLMDVCYVNNFKNEDCPLILTFPAGDGQRFKKDMAYLIDSMRKAVPKIFMSEDYKDRNSRIVREFENRQKELIQGFEEKLTKAGFVMVQIQAPTGVRNEIQPLVDGEPSSLEKLEHLSKEGKFSLSRLDELRRSWDSLRRDFDATTIESKKLTSKLEDAIEKLNLSMVTPLIGDKTNLIKKRYADDKVAAYMGEVEATLTGDLDRFMEARPRRGEEEAPPFRKREPFEDFSVNLILDNSQTTSVPIVLEKSPSYKNLFGSLERVVDRFGYWRTDFTRIFSGSLLQASGGYLIINALDLLTEQGVWPYLKRALRNGEMEITGFDPLYMMAGSGIKPEPVPLSVKVILVGDSYIHNLLWSVDDDFKEVFRVKAEFDDVMPRSAKSTGQYFRFVRRVVDQEHLPPFDVSGMQAVTEYGIRLAGRRDKLSTRFATLTDIIREASIVSSQRKSAVVQRQDVYRAMEQKKERVNLVEDKIQEMFDNDTLLVSTTGADVGQINGLSVYSLADHSFGRPSRITVSTSLGRAGVINIEREADMSGPTHTKGVLVLSGYLRKMFAQDKPLSMSASISFEQSYGGIDGDSASSTEIYAILSSLSNIPIKQGIAVTGSVNQNGIIQPIGGVNEKIEGFFDVCRAKRLTGKQGVMIPHQNVSDLILRPDVVAAVKAGKFHIYPVKTIEEGISILTGVNGGKRRPNGGFPEGTVMRIVDDKLAKMALTYQNFGRNENDNGNGKGKPKKGSKKKKKK